MPGHDAVPTTPTYRGRFAPSPTGPLHFGSLLAAVASYLEAKSQDGLWLVRMEDIDEPRNVQGAADSILHTLDRFGFAWDGEVVYQTRRHAAYRDALDRLQRDGWLYACDCSRKDIATVTGWEGGQLRYPGTCRSRGLRPGPKRALRLITEDARISVVDHVQGHIEQDIEREIGDFVLRRGDGLVAYQLAVVVDDAEQGITNVVRGSDLLDSTPRQIHLQRSLGLGQPGYLHIPVATTARGEKLSKQTGAPPLDHARPVPALWAALRFLGQCPPADLGEADLDSLWFWAVANWSSARIPARRMGSDSPPGADQGDDEATFPR